MSTTFRAANRADALELTRLRNLLRNLQNIRHVTNWNAENWSEFTNANVNRLRALYEAKERNPKAYVYSKLIKTYENLKNKRKTRLAMYGYVPKMTSGWKYKGHYYVPASIPSWEAMNFRRVDKTGPGAYMEPLNTVENTRRWRNAFTAEGTLKAPSGKKPVAFKPKPNKRGFVPTLKELAWAAKSTNPNFETVKSMNNKQLKLLSKVGPINWAMMKPKKRVTPLPANNVTKYRRHAAARIIQKAVKKQTRAKTSQGFLLRTTSQRARNAQRLQRAPGPANNTRVTWSRRANGTINRHKTLEQLNLNLSQTERNALNKMSETNAMAYIRNLARAH